MPEPSFIEKLVSKPLDEFVGMPPETRAPLVRGAVRDLGYFLDEGAPIDKRSAPEKTRRLAHGLFEALRGVARDGDAAATLDARILTDELIRREADRDQNVYLGAFFTRRLTNAVPDLVFQPVSAAEASLALAWARAGGVPVTLRGAASTAMGGSVPHDGGLTLDLARLDGVDVDEKDGLCVIGAGARLRDVHAKLAARGLALRVYPSNLGGTFAGWFLTGGIGLNAFGAGRAIDAVRAADVLLPDGRHLRFHDDGRLDVPVEASHRQTLVEAERTGWFRRRGLEPFALADLAGSEGTLGLVLRLAVRIERRPDLGAFLLSFERLDAALEAAAWVCRDAGRRHPRPLNVKLFSGSHLHHMRAVWRDDDASSWRHRPGDLSSGAQLPFGRVIGPAEVGCVAAAQDRPHAEAYLYVDVAGLEAARDFAAALAGCPGQPILLAEESVRVARERFAPQQTKRLGPGLLAAEIVLPSDEVPRFLPGAERIARGAGCALDAEVYYLADGTALVIGGYLTDHRIGSFAVDLLVAPALLDLATKRHRGKPYVLGRWQSRFAVRKFGDTELRRLRQIKGSIDPATLVNRGVVFPAPFRGALGAIVGAGFRPAVALARLAYGSRALSWAARLVRRLRRRSAGPAHGRGEPLAAAAEPTARAIHCVNCGECNAVCPIFHESRIRLPQMLTHLGEDVHAGARVPATGSVLLDLCMRCGNCQEVCQAGIPHLPLYEAMQRRSDASGGRNVERHVAIVAALRASSRYRDEFLHVRTGGYHQRAAASLPGIERYLVLRAEGDDGPAATCIHCGACVPVCPTHANREFEGDDPRSITTVQDRCIGCGTCVEVCPANLGNGGQTLRVVEAPTGDFFEAVAEFEKMHPPG